MSGWAIREAEANKQKENNKARIQSVDARKYDLWEIAESDFDVGMEVMLKMKNPGIDSGTFQNVLYETLTTLLGHQ